MIPLFILIGSSMGQRQANNINKGVEDDVNKIKLT